MRQFAVLLCLSAASAFCQPQRPAADLILINGTVLTVDPSDSIAQAVAITSGKIAAVGSTASIQKLAGPKTRVIDLHGRTVTPGLIDTHCHFQEAAQLYDVELSDAASISDVLNAVKRKAASLKPGEWVRGSGWDEGKLAELRYLYASDLDAVSPKNPVWLTQTTGHYGAANSDALKLAGVTKETKDPPAGTIDRDKSGQPTGVLKESAAALVTRLIPAHTKVQQRNGLLKIIGDFNREGMTAAKNPGIGPEDWQLYQELLREGKLSVRVFALWHGGRTLASAQAALELVKAQPKPPLSFDGLLLSGGIKLYMDGSGGARTAWMYQDWNPNPPVSIPATRATPPRTRKSTASR